MNGQMMDSQLTLDKMLSRAKNVYPRQQIVSRLADESIHRYSFDDFYKRVIRLMNALRELGVKPGDRVASFAWNSHSHMELYFAVPCIGAVLHTLNLRLPPSTLGEIINHAEDKLIFLDKSLAKPLLGLRSELKSVERLVVIDDRPAPSDVDFNDTLDYEELLAAASEEEKFPQLEESQAAALCYTSGTTGAAKGVLYSHRSIYLCAMGLCMADGIGLSMRETVLPVVPMFHVNGWGIPFAACLTGSKLVFPGPHMLGKSLAELMQDEEVTLAAGIPSIWLLLFRSLKSGNYNVPKLKKLLVGGAAMPQSGIEDFKRELGITMIHAWGMTETSPYGSICRLQPAMEETWSEQQKFKQLAKQGVPAALVEMKVVDDDDAPLPRDGKSFGELLVRGPWVASSYFRADEAVNNAAFTKDGWFRTGDISTIDEHGYMQVVDRKKDLIKTRGEWVSSLEMETSAIAHEAIVEAAVVGRPDKLRGEAVVMYIVVAENAEAPTPAEMGSHLANDFEDWQIPKHKDIHVVAELPKTTIGKLDKNALRASLRA